MEEKQDVQPKNIAQLMIKLATTQAQIKLVKSAIFMNKQKQTIEGKMKSFKEYAEGQAEKYSQNMEEATKAIEVYKSAIEEAMKQYEEDYLGIMANQDFWQDIEVKEMGKEKQLSLDIKEQRKTKEYKEWKMDVNKIAREIKAQANDPDKVAKLAEELKELKAKDPTLAKQQQLENIKQDRESTSEMIQYYDAELENIKNTRDNKLSELLENKETSLAKIQKQNLWQKLIAKFTSKSKSFKDNVVTPIMDKATNIKNKKIPQIIENIKNKQEARKLKNQENVKKMKDFKDKVVDKVFDAKDTTVKLAKKGIRAVVDFGRETKKATVRTIEGLGTKIADSKDNIKESLRTAVENSTQTLEDLNSAR